jgi:lipooligosaccharide transport system ATP-binding protein
MSGDVLVQARGLVKSYSGKRVVDGLDLACARGTVVGLLGPNGAGKTTTIRMLYGFLTPEAGTVHYGGDDFAHHRDRWKRRIGVVTQDDTLDTDLSVAQNLQVYAGYFRPKVQDLTARVDELLATFDLRPHRDQPPSELSGGFKRRLLIARALVHSPAVLYLDEPTTGLDPAARVEVWHLVAKLRAEGLSVVLTTHYMDEAERLSDSVVVLAHGKTIAQGRPRDLLGSILGDHVAVVACTAVDSALVRAWSSRNGREEPHAILDEWHLPVRATELADLGTHFSGVPFELRRATLEDLFLQLQRDQDRGPWAHP